VYETAPWEKSVSYATWRVLVDGLPRTTYNTYFVWTLHLPWSTCSGIMNSRLPLSLRWTVTDMSVGLPAYRRCYPLDVSLRFLSPEPCTKCILAYSALLNRAILFCFIASLPSEVMWAISDCSPTSVLWRHEAPPHEHTRKFKTVNFQPFKSEIVTKWSIVCLHFMLQINHLSTS
jgi:hypothetical protein